MKTIAIYHKDCTDGTTAAAVVLRKYPDALTFPLSHGYERHEIEAIVAQAAIGDRILTVDCVIGAREFLAAGHKVTSVDHHAGVNAEYAQLAKENPSFNYVFDNSKSGASLTWSYLFPDEPVPQLVKLVEDADLWHWAYGQDTKEVGSYMFMLFNQPAEVLKLLSAPLDAIKRDGAVISRYSDIVTEHAIKTTEPITVNIGPYAVALYNITGNKSAAGNILAKERSQAVGLFTVDAHQVKVSFRSLDAHAPSALDIAQAAGGNGHRNAAGAAIPLSKFVASIVEKK